MALCSVCNSTLVQGQMEARVVGTDGRHASVCVDECPACRGMWFDEAEIEATTGFTTPLAALAAAPGRPGERRCVRCACAMNVVRTLGVDIDVCPQCRGIWLDPGELRQIFEEYRATHELEGGLRCAHCGVAGFTESDLNYGKEGLVCDECLAHEDEWGAWHRAQAAPPPDEAPSDSTFHINGIQVGGLFGLLKALFS